MNKLKGKITNITTSGNISLVEAEVCGITMSSIVIGSPQNTGYMKMGGEIYLVFKESEVSIAKNFSGEISLRNQLEGEILNIQQGEVFSKITFDFKGNSLISLITTRSVQKLALKEGEIITGMIKANEVILMEIE